MASSSFEAGLGFLSRGLAPAAIRCFDRAQKLGFPADRCAGARWRCWMLLGRYERAWEESDFVEEMGAPDPNRLWNGAAWDGKRVVLRGLHGLGDTIQFIRYASSIASRTTSLIAQVHPQLVTLIQGVTGIDKVYSWEQESEQRHTWDVQMEVIELPRIFRTNVRNVPREIPYIRVPEERLAWSRHVIGNSKRLRVGLIWESGPWDPARSIPFEALDPILAGSKHDFYALQKGFEQNGSIQFLRNPEIHSRDVRDTAALMQHMDLIISADTMSAHLAGALGRPLWILLPFEADWRWMLDREHTPWYPTARLFRQARPGDWAGVVRSIAERLSGETALPRFA